MTDKTKLPSCLTIDQYINGDFAIALAGDELAFSLPHKTKAEAIDEACRIYRAIERIVLEDLFENTAASELQNRIVRRLSELDDADKEQE